MADRPARLVSGERTARLATRLRAAAPLAGWGWTALAGVVAATQATGSTPLNVLYVLQALTLPLLAPCVPLAGLALWRRRYRMAATDAAISLALLVLIWPVVSHGAPPDVDDGAPTLRIAFANTYFENERTGDVADALLDEGADLVAMAELTVAQERALEATGAFAEYPYRVGTAETDRDGIALYSRIPFVRADARDLGSAAGIDAVVELDGEEIRVLVVHPPTGVHQSDLDDWRADLETLGRTLDAADGPTVVVGDFNASRWHPAFRDLLDRTGFHDAHEWLGRGFSTSWPVDGLIPPFVRIDHALLSGLSPTDLADVETPGSDHRGFVIDLAIAG